MGTTAMAYRVERSGSPVPQDERERLLAAPAFGTVFTDHMARATWTSEGGWQDRRVVPYGPLELAPEAAVLHYGQEIFEGLKAFRHEDGSIWAFRPEANGERFISSAQRLALPELPVAEFLSSIEALVAVDADWVPEGDETSLYLRPFMFAAEPQLLVRPAYRVEYVLIACPVGPYFASGVAPVSIWVAEDLHRAGRGGTGAAKCGGNYAASLASQQVAYDHGCPQVCFLDAATGMLLEELGGMNVFVVFNRGEVATPRLCGTFLEGITRSSVLTLLASAGREVSERDLPLAEVLEGLRTGEVTEMFACGTGAAITPIGRLAGAGFDLQVADGQPGAVTAELRRWLTDIQYGRLADEHGWMRRLG